MLTPFESINASFSNLAHKAAMRDFYPHLFKTNDFEFEKPNVNTFVGRLLDCKMAIDYIAGVNVLEFNAPLIITIQERWRETKYLEEFGPQVTITEWNHLSGERSELHKLCAQIVVYGYYDHTRDKIVKAVAISAFGLMRALAQGTIPFERRKNPKDQSFLVFRFDDLNRLALIWCEYDENHQSELTQLELDLLRDTRIEDDLV